MNAKIFAIAPLDIGCLLIIKLYHSVLRTNVHDCRNVRLTSNYFRSAADKATDSGILNLNFVSF